MRFLVITFILCLLTINNISGYIDFIVHKRFFEFNRNIAGCWYSIDDGESCLDNEADLTPKIITCGGNPCKDLADSDDVHNICMFNYNLAYNLIRHSKFTPKDTITDDNGQDFTLTNPEKFAGRFLTCYYFSQTTKPGGPNEMFNMFKMQDLVNQCNAAFPIDMTNNLKYQSYCNGFKTDQHLCKFVEQWIWKDVSAANSPWQFVKGHCAKNAESHYCNATANDDAVFIETDADAFYPHSLDYFRSIMEGNSKNTS